MSLVSRFISRRVLLAERFLYSTPALLGCRFEEVEVAAHDGAVLRGWFLPGERPGAVIFCPGNSGNVSSHILYLGLIRRTGCSVLAFDYGGFGQSDGRPDVRRLADDILAARRWLGARLGPAAPLALMGISLGASSALAAAVRLAPPEDGAELPAVRALVVEGIADQLHMLAGLFLHGSMGPVRIRRLCGPLAPCRERRRLEILERRPPRLLAGALASFCCRFNPSAGKRPALLAPRLRELPIFVVHGVEDAVLPFEAALDLHAALGARSRLWLIPEAGHAQEPALSHGAEYTAQLEAFLADSFASGQGSDPRPPVRGRLLTCIRGDSLEQRVLADGAGAPEPEAGEARRAAQVHELEVYTLASDGFPPAELDPLSHRYRQGGYRVAFRALVEAVNSRDFESLDRALGDYVELPRALPFDFLAATYCIRLVEASLAGLKGWPRPAKELGRRNLERFELLWSAHPELPGKERSASPLAWSECARRELRR
jgi:pimeloyl-ACP methyl ester carboxylesterase